jgi:hypothetical protein
MTFESTRSASLRTVALAISLGSVFAGSLTPAQSLLADNQAAAPAFVSWPSNPAPPFPADLISQENDKPQLPPVPMPQDRAQDSYNIYSVLLPVGELADPGWPRNLWLLSDTTVALVPPDKPCLAGGADGSIMNPHVAVEPPPDRLQDFAELLDDFDRRCHERIHLTSEFFNLVVPLRLLSQAEQDKFIRTRFDPTAGADADQLTAQYKGAPGLSRFSQVYFNAHHTVAMVYANGWCGGLCEQSYWQVLAVEDGSWKRLGWRSAVVMN